MQVLRETVGRRMKPVAFTPWVYTIEVGTHRSTTAHTRLILGMSGILSLLAWGLEPIHVCRTYKLCELTSFGLFT